MRVISACMFLCAVLMPCVRDVAADETRDLNEERIAEANAQYRLYGIEIGIVLVRERLGEIRSVVTLSYEPRAALPARFQNDKVRWPKLAGLGIRRVYLRSRHIPQPLSNEFRRSSRLWSY